MRQEEIRRLVVESLKLKDEIDDLREVLADADIPEELVTQIFKTLESASESQYRLWRTVGRGPFTTFPLRDRVAAAIADIGGGVFTTKDVEERLISSGLITPAKGLSSRISGHIRDLVAKNIIEVLDPPRRGHAGEYRSLNEAA